MAVRKEVHRLPFEVCRLIMNLAHYLPNTEKRIETLRKIINGRPVAIILQGFSTGELEERINEIKDCDICYSSLNSFWVVEKYILEKINRNCSIIMCSAPQALEGEIGNVINVLERPENNLFISTKLAFNLAAMPQWFDLSQFMAKHDEKLLFFDAVYPFFHHLAGWLFAQFPSEEFPLHFVAQNSLSILLSLVVIGEPSRVVIFGGDGGRIDPNGLYFKEPKLTHPQVGPLNVIEETLTADARTFNETMLPMLGKLYKIFDLKPVEIINCSEKSHYTPFRKLSYDETFSLLRR